MYWETMGKQNTEQTLELALGRARDLEIKHVVVASNTGDTAKLALAKASPGTNIVCVTHHVGYAGPGVDEMPANARQELMEKGVNVLTTTHLFANVERAITGTFGGLYPGGIVSYTLRLFGNGLKTAVEIAIMALDAGLIPYGEEVISIAGTGRGADTAIVILPAHSRNFFDSEILELICMPRRKKKPKQ